MAELASDDVATHRDAAPNFLLTLAEAQRAAFEAVSLLTLQPLLGNLARGDGHPVLVLPGFMATDQSTAVFRGQLGRLGYDVRPWGLGRNVGPRGNLLEVMIDATVALAAERGQTVSLIGQSLGGIYAREVARRSPDSVRQVITLGSPFGTMGGGGTNSGVARLFQMSTGRSPAEARREYGFGDMREPPPVPSTAIYSRTDGIAHWRICIERDTPTTDNVEIIGSHCGMAFNPIVVWVAANRLAQPAAQWRRLARKGLSRYLFPEPPFAP